MSTILRIRVPLFIACSMVCAFLSVPLQGQTFGCSPAAVNPIVCENSKPGNSPSDWDLPGGVDSTTGDPTLTGFATDISVNQGGMVHFKVNSTASAYRIDIYRIGYYGGLGGRLVATVTPSVTLPQSQPACLTDTSTGLIDCGNWAESASWAVPTNATSGLYVGKLVRPDTGGSNHIVFVVRADGGGSQMLFQTSDTTWQAYNDFGGNSLYVGNPAGRAYKVSYNRPFVTRQRNSPSWFLSSEYPMIRFLEANGYDVSYATGVDSDRSGTALLGHKVFVSVGHDEYWSGLQRANVEAARDAGVHLGFFSGNEIWWKTRWENSIDGSNTTHRTLVCYKETLAGTRLDPDDPPTWTGSWRDPSFSPPADGGRPENALSGTLFYVQSTRNDAIKIPASFGRLRFWRNTAIASLAPGATYTTRAGILGYEWDQELDNGFRPAGLIDLSSTTLSVSPDYLLDYGANYGSGTATHNLALYRASSGSLVFGAGTVQWSWGLDGTHDFFSDQPPPADPNLQQATVNLLADMGVQSATLQPGLLQTTASADLVAPTSIIDSPLSGGSASPGVPLTISGTASDQGGGVVAAVEISIDGGTTWHRASGQENWSYVWTPTSLGNVTIKTRAVDDSVNLETPSAGVSISVVPANLVSITVTPANSSAPAGFPQRFTATGTFSNGNTQNLTGSVTWTSSNPAAATINAAGLANAIAPGTTNIQATVGSISGSTGMTVTTASLVSIAVAPANISIGNGALQQFTATGTFSDGTALDVTSMASWNSTNNAVATINSAGLATGAGGGTTTIQATLDSVAGSTGLTVSAAAGPIAYWKFDDGSGTTAADSSANGHTIALAGAMTWVAGKIGGAVASTGTTGQYASVAAIDLSATKTVTLAFWANRTYTTSGGHTLFEDSPNYNNSSTGFGFFPDDKDCKGIMAGFAGNVGYSINCYHQPSSGVWHHLAVIYDKTMAANAQVALYVDGILQAPSQNYLTAANTNTFGNNTLYLFSRGGTQEFSAGQMDDLRIYNRALAAGEIQQLYQAGSATLVSIATSPSSPIIPSGLKQQFTATGTFSDGSTQNVTTSVTWTSSNTTAATIDATGLATAAAVGSTTIQASSGSVSNSTGMTVIPALLTSITVTPANSSVATNGTVQFTATGVYSDGSTQNLTSFVGWSSSNGAVATISPSGLASGVAKGSTTIQATSSAEGNSISGTTSLSVTATLVSIAVTPANPSVAAGLKQQFTATGTYSDNSTQNLTSSVIWTSSGTSTATINAAGLATGLVTGTTTIQAASGSIVGTTGLTVTPATLVSLAVTPSNPSITKSATRQFTATGTFSDNGTQNLTSSVIWNSTNAAVATIADTGLAIGVAMGSTSIQATSGSVVGSTTLTVTPPTLVSIVVTPANPSIPKGMAQQFVATGTYADGSTQTLATVSWSSTSVSVATISSGGLASGVGIGTTTINAASGSVTAGTGLTVTAPLLISITVTPPNSTITTGATQQYTATGTFSDGSMQNLTASATWSSSNTAVATVSSVGLATAGATGNATIQAVVGSVTGATGLTVSATLPGLVGYWTFDEGSGATAADSSGNGYTAALTGATWAPGEYGDAVSGSGSAQYVTIPAINLTGKSAVTISMWVNRNYSTAGGHTLFENSANYNSSTTGFGVFPDDSTCHGVMIGEKGNAGYNVKCYNQPSSGVWHHLVVVFDKSQAAAGEITFYIDGVLQTPTQSPSASNNTNAFGNNKTYIFARGGTTEFAAGAVDQVQIFDRGLSAAEIASLK